MRKIASICFLCLISILLVACQAERSPTAKNPPGKVLFEDDFSDTASGWENISGEPGFVGYEDGAYRMRLKVPFYTSWVTPDKVFNAVSIEVDATQTGGPDKSVYGVVCRAQDDKNFYVFVVSAAGYYGIGKVVDGQGPSMLGTSAPDQLNASDAIKKMDELNHIRADCNGNVLTLFINGKQVSSVQDDAITSGDVGLLVKTFEQPGIDVTFDNFAVKIP